VALSVGSRAARTQGWATLLRALGQIPPAECLPPLAFSPEVRVKIRERLRTLTVIHHLDALRLAGLVHLMLEEGEKRRYAARPEAVQATFTALGAFLENSEEDEPKRSGCFEDPKERN
jgi:hypothetical protein